jgi:hypothetical protein
MTRPVRKLFKNDNSTLHLPLFVEERDDGKKWYELPEEELWSNVNVEITEKEAALLFNIDFIIDWGSACYFVYSDETLLNKEDNDFLEKLKTFMHKADDQITAMMADISLWDDGKGAIKGE